MTLDTLVRDLRFRLGTGYGLSNHEARELLAHLDALGSQRCPFCGADVSIEPDEDGTACLDVTHAEWCPMADAIADTHQLVWFEPDDGETTDGLLRRLRLGWKTRTL